MRVHGTGAESRLTSKVGLSQRAQHPPEQLQLLHGSLFNVKCTSFYCNYSDQNFTDPIVPALDIPMDNPDPTSNEARHAISDALDAKRTGEELDISNVEVHLPSVKVADLPQCPKCNKGLLRPGVVWFGESLPHKVISTVDKFLNESEKVDLIIVIGTSAKVYPAAGYVDQARAKGARVAVVNTDDKDYPASGLFNHDWFFKGDASELVPEMLKSVIGEN